MFLLFIGSVIPAAAQNAPRVKDLEPMCDSLQARLQRRTTVDGKVTLSNVMKRGSELDLYFSTDLAYYPWHKTDVDWFTSQVTKELSRSAKGFTLGRIFCRKTELSEYITPVRGNGGKPSGYRFSSEDPGSTKPRFVDRPGSMHFPRGLNDRYIAIWQSHGRIYDEEKDIWRWQRATLHGTVEDMYTQSYVLPFLIPMLENAGAYVMTPRERDIQRIEYICDNDKAFSDERSGETRRDGFYSESGRWSSAGEGFADFKRSYTFTDNPFTAGTARVAACSGSSKVSATANWTADIEKRGEYAVYVSYKTLPNSSEAARYTVHHLGGDTVFTVNQKRGGGTWIYLGTFEFAEGKGCSITLDNSGSSKEAVSADAVKIGGGMGKLERGGKTSGMPSSAEGAHYWMQWAGVGPEITRNWETDYTNDYATRGAWTEMMVKEKHIPFDLALAFHSDAGVMQNDSIVGTLGIYTLLCDGKRSFEDGRDRIISRVLTEYVQDQVVSDIRADYEPDWARRQVWDKSYSESRTAGVPAMILELLSHQNFADMKCGLDPGFRFTVSRAVYKGILKTLSEFYGCRYMVQPLPVHNFAVRLDEGGNALLSWSPTNDSKEPTAKPSGYMVYTRTDDGAFDAGRAVSDTSAVISMEKGRLYSFKVAAYNDGGISFPSETLAAGIPASGSKDAVVIVNDFDRISAPAWIDYPDYAGFDGRMDSGVPYLRDISYIGSPYEFRRDAEYVDDDYPGFGACYDDCAGNVVAGNSFDYPAVHGKALLSLGYPFFSLSREAFCAGNTEARILDLICGKQATTKTGTGVLQDRFEVFPSTLRSVLAKFTADGGNVFLSGANIASDAPADFISTVFGYELANRSGGRSGIIGGMEFWNSMNPECYCVESPDAIRPSGSKGNVWLRYTGSNLPAAVRYDAGVYRTVSIGVPLETVKSETDRRTILESALKYLDGNSEPVDHSQKN